IPQFGRRMAALPLQELRDQRAAAQHAAAGRRQLLNRRPPHRKQQGVVLLVAIIALVALTLAALAVTLSGDTSNVIAGNLAFQRSATHSAELGLEVAMQWLEASKTETAGNCGGPKLYCHQEKDGYAATRLGDDQVRSWLDYWQ